MWSLPSCAKQKGSCGSVWAVMPSQDMHPIKCHMSHMALRATSSVPSKGPCQSFSHGPKVCVQELTWLWVPSYTQLCPAALGLPCPSLEWRVCC